MAGCTRVSLSRTAASEAACAAAAFLEFVEDPERCLNDRHEDELGYPIEWLDGEGVTAAVPAAHHQGSLIIGVDQADEIAEDDAMPMPEARSRQDQRGKPSAVNLQVA